METRACLLSVLNVHCGICQSFALGRSAVGDTVLPAVPECTFVMEQQGRNAELQENKREQSKAGPDTVCAVV